MSAEWLYEAGIGEERAIYVANGAILSARLDWGETVKPGLVAPARLVMRYAGSRRGIVRLEDGTDALIDQLPREATEGVPLTVRIVRSAISERGRTKLPVARNAPGEGPNPAPTLREELEASGARVRAMPSGSGEFSRHGWDELVGQAMSGEIAFAGGALLISATPAMTLFDIDGSLPPLKLSLAAVGAIADALHQLDIAGNIGIDFPTLPDKKDRQHVDKALGDALLDWQGERTSMNGFGFVQLVARLERPSLISRFDRDPAGAMARQLLRRAESVKEPGALCLEAHPRVLDAITPAWEAELARRTGRTIRRRAENALGLHAVHVQAVPL